MGDCLLEWGAEEDIRTSEVGSKRNLHDLYSTPKVMQVIKTRRNRWMGPVARVDDRRNSYRVSVRKHEGK